MAMTDDKELAYGYFSQTLLPDYIEETRRPLGTSCMTRAGISRSPTPTGA